MNASIIRSIGPPPQRHADRVVAEMMRALAKTRAHVSDAITDAVLRSSDGSPKAQRKMEERVMRAGAVQTQLTPGKRGQYTLLVYDMCGWDQTSDQEISVGDSVPDKPWLACNITLISSDGRGREEVQLKSTPLVFVTHHALSRAAQRFGVRGSEHMITVAESVWDAAFRLINDKGGVENALAAPPDGWRTMMEIMDVRATVVLKRHEKRHALVAATVF